MVKALRIEETCPKCGNHLMVREGESGDFLACPRFPSCKFTKPLPDTDMRIYQKPSPYCERCNHTGLIPFVKDGKKIPHAFLYCECHQEQEHYLPLKLEDFDFPMSYAWRAYYEETIWGRYLPALEEPSIEPTPKVEESEWTERQWDRVTQLGLDQINLRKTLYETLKEIKEASASKRKPKTRY